ncbi:hypothetical protein, partial [Escherichia coli]|uniref:hypothetical protein n=1 Tax=Escherichia coli TaxID=562 RepID=UPI001FCD14E1
EDATANSLGSASAIVYRRPVTASVKKTHPDRKTTPRPGCHGIPAPITKEYVKNAFNPIPGARANGAFPKIANISVPMAVASMVTVIRAALTIPA